MPFVDSTNPNSLGDSDPLAAGIVPLYDDRILDDRLPQPGSSDLLNEPTLTVIENPLIDALGNVSESPVAAEANWEILEPLEIGELEIGDGDILTNAEEAAIATEEDLIDTVADEDLTVDDTDSDTSNTSEPVEQAIADEVEVVVDPIPEIEPLPVLELTHTTPGLFTVGSDGTIRIDYNYDRGKFESEVAIVSTAGLENFLPTDGDFSQFNAEVSRRALSDSELGHIVIADATEGARFSSTKWGPNRNSGTYLGVKSFQMNPGDNYMVVMVPNRTFQETLDKSATDRSQQLLFSVSQLNPGEHVQFVQVAAANADGNLFGFEDLRIDRNSDKSFNDIVLQMRGGEGPAPLLSDVIDPSGGFWSQNMGQALIDYGDPYVSPIPVTEEPDPTVPGLEEPCVMPDGCTGGHLDVEATSADGLPLQPGLETDVNITAGESEASIDTLADDGETLSDEGTEEETFTDSSSDTDELTEDNADLPPESAEDGAIENSTHPISIPESVIPERFEFPQKNQPVIGFIDTGLAANHPDLDYGNITLGTDRVDGDDDPLLQPGEGSEHGTHVIGIIAAQQDNGIGIDGINPDAPIIIERAIGSGEWAESLIALVDRIQESEQPNGIINLSQDLIQTNPDGSIATRYELTPKERAAIEYARQHNILLVVAAGNDNGVMSALGQAGQEFDNIATVGAAQRLDVDPSIPDSEAFIRADYSSYGYGLSLVAEGGTVDNPIFSTVGTGIGSMAGSSVAAAHVTGGASLVWAANPGLNYRQVLQILKDTSTDLSTTDWDAETGSGLLNVDAAVKLAKVTAPEEYAPPMSFIPDTWGGEGIVIPGERAVEIYQGNFGGQVTSTIGANLRSGPGTNYSIVETVGFDEPLNYDAWTVGEFVSYPGLGEDDRWYRIAGTNLWISAAITTGEPPTISPEPTPNPIPDPAYYPDLASLSNAQWNEYTGDNTRFDYGWPDYIDERHLTPEPIRDIYTDLSNAVLGKRGLVTAGYLLDPGYRQGIGKWHSGIDLDADPGDAVKVAVGGNVVTIQSISGDYFMGVQGDDGKLWIYGHLGTVAVPSGRIETGQTIGTIGSASHLHLEVQPGPNYSSSQNADQNVVGNATLNPVKSFWELQNQNSFVPIDPETPGGSQPAIPGQQTEYIIKPGDTLSDIARRYLGDGSRWSEIMKSPNGETFTPEEAKLLQIGQSVYLPVTYETGNGGYVSNPPVNGSTNGMRPYEFGHLGALDDTLWEIAERELGSGFRWTEIRKADGTTYNSAQATRISRGTTVYLPTEESSDGGSSDIELPPDNDPIIIQPTDDTVSNAGLEFIAGHEGTRLNLYNDPAGHCTIGIGHLVHLGACNGSEPAEFQNGITTERALELLRTDSAQAVQAVKELVRVPLKQHQFDALVSFTFNLGQGNLRISNLLKRLNAGEYDAVPYELSRWNKATVNGQLVPLPGLTRRREEEGILFRDGIYT